MNLRVLIYMNPLMVDKVSKKFLYEKDSGFLCTKQLIESLPTDWRFTVLVPRGFGRSEAKKFFGDTHFIHPVEYDYSTSIHQNRYHFNRNILAKAFPYGTDVDLVINNQPEVTANLRAFFMNQRREKPIIVNYFHWIDCPESQNYGQELGGYLWRQIDGYLQADESYFHSHHAGRLFMDAAKELCGGKDIVDRYDLFHPMPTLFGKEPIKIPYMSAIKSANKKIVLFNHRLNNSTGWQHVLEVCEDIQKERDDFVLWFTDDQNLKVRDDLQERGHIVKSVPFEQYGYLLENAHFSVCNTTGYATWNLSVPDSIANGCLPLCPDIDLYRQMFAGTGVYWDNLRNAIVEHLDKPREENQARAKAHLMFDAVPALQDFVETEIRERVEGKTPAKYEDVKDYILHRNAERGGTQKSEYVNNFWSFHANSNFQLIRWKLLTEGFKDDINWQHTRWLNPDAEVKFVKEWTLFSP